MHAFASFFMATLVFLLVASAGFALTARRHLNHERSETSPRSSGHVNTQPTAGYLRVLRGVPVTEYSGSTKARTWAPPVLHPLDVENSAGSITDETQLPHVLVVGSLELGSQVHDTLLGLRVYRLSISADFRELWTLQQQVTIDVAILHESLSNIELDEVSRFIRRRWPHARILIIRAGEGFLEDALYDERLLPATTTGDLLAAIERLAKVRGA